ncbi:MAG: SUMF1/EgtB/PvdO family nonheme iron enzyme [Planctomycetes bacterium]|nr:SUMF1/EgtB/PvdO family nonheme iron enzyme [Planctomycetota bacterium]
MARVVRGGAWNNNAANARSAARNDNNPDNRNDNIGFRVLCSSHIVIIPERCFGTDGNSGRPRFAGRVRGAIDGAGESRPHVVVSRRAHIEAGRHLDLLPWRPPTFTCWLV